MVAAINAKLEKAENDYASEQADDPPARKKRDDANADLAQRWSDVKGQLARRFGDATPREFGLEGELPATPDAVVFQKMADWLRDDQKGMEQMYEVIRSR